ncbi:MAG TPA: hypothetical protein PLS55_12245 [Thermogutta sp.]|nr:hypothetical protein [Thermogutta sp.]
MAAFSSVSLRCRRPTVVWRRVLERQNGIRLCRFVVASVVLVGTFLCGPRALAQFFPPVVPPQPQERGRMGQFPPQMGRPGSVPGRNQPRGQGEQLPRIEASGTVEVLTPAGLQIVSPSGQKWQLVLERECQVELTGKALPDVLRPGTVVSFTADIEKKTGKATEKVASIAVCSIDQDHQLGVFPDQGLGGLPVGDGAAGGEMGGVGFGQGPNAFGLPGGGFGSLGSPGEEPARPRRGRQNAQDEPPVERYQVCGRISTITKLGQITVVAPNPHFRAPVQIELVENPEITLELSGRDALSLVRPGSKISGRGVQIGPTAARISELKVELVEPFTFAPPKKERPHAEEAEKPHPRPGVRTPSHRTPDEKASEGEKESPPTKETAPPDQSDPPKAAGIELPPLP